MRWPWRQDIDAARRQAEDAARHHAAATRRHAAAATEQKKAVKVTKALRADVEVNGWTELLRQAMGGAPQ